MGEPVVETKEEKDLAHKRLMVNLDLCIGCKSCSSACAVNHIDEVPRIWHSNYAGVAEVAWPCRQCEEAPCLNACPANALRKDEAGIISRLGYLCVGCRSCVMACPFGVISEDLEYRIIAKCDLCRERVKTGQLPRCVETCPTGALSLTEEAEVQAQKLVLIGSRMVSFSPYQRRA